MESDKYNQVIDKLKHSQPALRHQSEISEFVMRSLDQGSIQQKRAIHKAITILHPLMNIAASILLCLFLFTMLDSLFQEETNNTLKSADVQNYFNDEGVSINSSDYSLRDYLDKKEEQSQNKHQLLKNIYNKKLTNK